jgi:hypothetical protein
MKRGKARPEMPGKSGQPRNDDAVGTTLNARQEQAVLALVNEPTVIRAAAVAGVHERTLRRWLHEPVFRSALLTARRDSFSQAIGLTQKYAAVAVAALVKILQDNTVPPAAKVAAAAVLLRFGREGVELDDLAERVEALERAMPPQLTLPATERDA